MASEKLLTQIPPVPERWRDPLYYFTLLFLAFLQGIFKNREEGSYKWSEDEELTEIVIADQITNFKETVPRVITARGPIQFIQLFCDDMVTRKLTKNERKRTSLISIPMTINVIAKIGIETQELAFFIAHNIWAHRILLQQHGIHKIDRNFSISPETPTGAVFAPEVVPEGVMISIIVPFIVRWTSTMVPNDAPMLHSIDSFLRTRLGPSIDKPEKDLIDKINPLEIPTPNAVEILT
jgi:hypothetical protein